MPINAVWQDRVVEKPRTYSVVNNPDSTITLTPAPGQVVQEGTPVNAGNMNAILAATGVTAGSSTALTLAVSGFVLSDGVTVRIKLHTALGPRATLNVNNTGARSIVNAKGKAAPSGLRGGAWLTLVYSAATSSFILQGEGGGVPGSFNFARMSTQELMLVHRFMPPEFKVFSH